ncbi:predicted protein [Nematostella vectensis]|uniref:Arsenite methyltransferase n=1 Tax=Nematostella vectensis TaxID=45351 RepID=A7RZM6_NEMVE|nr:predicted protein [Nematostella vectensis]|eukprot:XP_001635188.1 predicted protein [Nematostella vectensis]
MDIKESVKDYYGKRLNGSDDLQTDVCKTQSCNMVKTSPSTREALELCNEEVVKRYFGCGLVFPECLDGCRILDLGSGSGRDCYVLSKLVGEEGFITGVDMTPEQLDIANKYKDYHAKKFGYSKSNTEFLMGDIENLQKAGVKDDSYDIVVSNCVVNLTTDKRAVLQETWRVLKDGGEVYFSDIYADRVLSEELRQHQALWGECIAGALWWRELVDLCKDIGFSGPYLVVSNKTTVESEELRKVLGKNSFVSATYRLIKSPRHDNSDQIFEATYKGTLPDHEKEFVFDVYTTFKTGQQQSVDAAVANILRISRYSKHFDLSNESTKRSEPGRDAYQTADPFIWLKTDGGTEMSCCPSSKKASSEKPCC